MGTLATLAGSEALTNKSVNGVTLTTGGSSTNYLNASGSYSVIAGGGDALTSGTLSQFAATTSSQLAGVISDETGSGALVFATSPTLVTPILGTPTSVTLTIAITTDTMRLSPGGTTGSRTLAANGIATAIKITATEWIISGSGLT